MFATCLNEFILLEEEAAVGTVMFRVQPLSRTAAHAWCQTSQY